MVTIIDPHIKRDSGYHIHSQATEHQFYVKKKDGADYEGWCWPGSSSWVDFFNPEAQKWWASKFQLDNYQVCVCLFPDHNKEIIINVYYSD